jgi:hypothetical protein
MHPQPPRGKESNTPEFLPMIYVSFTCNLVSTIFGRSFQRAIVMIDTND